MRIFPKDAPTIGEKIAYSLGFGIPVVLFLFMLLSAFGIFHNFYSEACAEAGLVWRAVGLVFTSGLVYGVYLWVTDNIKKPSFWMIFALAAFSLLSFCAFTTPYWSK